MEPLTEIKIRIPEGYKIDEENSTFECIKFRPKKLTYEDIAVLLFKGEIVYYTDSHGHSMKTDLITDTELYTDATNCSTIKQVERLMAFNKLTNVAKYLNGKDWKPNYNGNTTYFYIILNGRGQRIHIEHRMANLGTPCFRSKELANKAIEILGEETIKLALSYE